MKTEIEAQKFDIATACRVMAHRGLVEDVLGHISLRVGEDRMLMRCRGPEEAGLRFTRPDDIRLVDAATGDVLDDASGTYACPSELPIHTAVLAARPDVECVVHAHPPNVVVLSIAGLEMVPLIGAYNIPATRLAESGIATYPRSVLIRTEALGSEMVHSLGRASAAILVGHGLVTTGTTVAEAVLRALHIDTLARLSLGVHAVGSVPRPIAAEDMQELPDLGPGFNETTLWRYHLASLDADGRGLKETL